MIVAIKLGRCNYPERSEVPISLRPVFDLLEGLGVAGDVLDWRVEGNGVILVLRPNSELARRIDRDEQLLIALGELGYSVDLLCVAVHLFIEERGEPR
jgi:hypothetical protein